MSSSTLSPSFGWRLLLAGLVGLAFAACFPPFDLSFLLPVAIAVFLALLEGLNVRQAEYVGIVFGMVFFGTALSWLYGMFGTAAIALWVLPSAFLMLFAALTVWLREKRPRFPFPLLVAIVWTGVEFGRSEIMVPRFAWMGLGYAFVTNPFVAPLASWIGSYGLTFLLVLLAAGLYHMGRRTRVASARYALAAGMVLTSCLLGAHSPFTAPVPPSHPLTVRLVQADSEDDESLFRLSKGRPVDLLLWPEYSFISDPTRNPSLWEQLRRLPQENHCYFVFGAKDQFDTKNEAAFRNTAWLIGPDGQVVGTHVKNHPVPLFRDGVAGTDARAFSTSIGRLGIATCFDFDFQDVARRLVDNGAEVFLVPSDNPREWGPRQHLQHRQMFQMRAVECDRWIATTDVAGNTETIDPGGREVARVSTVEPTNLDTYMGRKTGRTFFVSAGWLFGPTCFLVLVLLCLWSALSQARLRRYLKQPAVETAPIESRKLSTRR